ncbi:MAG: multicopper oxidase domain-containing protein [Nitrosopumilus sp.]|nr:multicopper oxidase domain-containing protein [Nitrosopumilus sp.]
MLIGAVLVVTSFNHILVIAQNGSDKEKERQNEKIVTGGHGSGYGSIDTSGDVLDSMNENTTSKTDIEPMKYLREFNYGRVSTDENGTTVREYTIVAQDKSLEVSPGVFFDAWTYNGTIPGPTIRATEGDTVRINFINNGSHSHTMHFHGIHKSEMDGVFDAIAPGGKFVYEFTAEPFGVFPYHCHVQPLEEHIQRGLYGVFIVDPKTPRPPADEMVMVMNGYDTDFDTENNFYTVNGISNYYMHQPIEIEKDRLIRVYLVNMLEFDQINNFHLHANMFNLTRSGTSLTPNELTDVVTMGQGERGILEFTYKYPGPYLFHAHKTEFAEKGWVGTLLVKESKNQQDIVALNKGEKSPYPAEINNNTTSYATEETKTNPPHFKGGSNYLAGQSI